MAPSPSNAASSAASSSKDISLGVAVAALFEDVRGLLSDAAEIVVAESQAALRRMIVAAMCVLGAGLLAGLGLVALLAAVASELVSRGLSMAAALLCVALLCAVGGMLLWGAVTRVLRHASFATSRRLLRGRE